MRRTKKMMTIFMLMIIFCMPVSVMAANEQELNLNKVNEVVTREERLVWRYKIVDGKMYKCLYNEKTGEYVGDWILIG